MRLDRALAADFRAALRSRAVLAFLGLQLLAGGLFVVRRGSDTLTTVLLVWVAMGILAFFAWWAGRHVAAMPTPDPVPDAAARSVLALLGAIGLTVWGFGSSTAVGALLLVVALLGWLWSAVRRRGWESLPARLLRDPRPFVPMLLLIAVPRLAQGGPAYLVDASLALPSGVGQQLLFLVGLFAPLEAFSRRTDVAAVAAALVFGLVHVPLDLAPNHEDLLAAAANAVFFQGSVGLIACLAFVRHRAVVPIGVAHALAIG